MKDNPDARLVIHNTNGDIVYEHALTGPNGLITRLEQYQTQEGLDREDRYLIELLFECEHEEEPDPDPDPEPDPEPDPDPDPEPEPEDPWAAITITINGWNLVEKPVEL